MKEKIKQKISHLELGTFSLLVFLRVFAQGIKYFPTLDDYIQYGCYPWYDDPVKEVFIRVGNLAKRPLATLADVYVWGKMWQNMWVALFIIALLYVLTVYFLYKCFDLDKSKGGIWFYLAALSPLMGEGIYWISASSRVVVGMFFASSACLCLKKYFDDKKVSLLASSFVLCLISMGFYEQIIVTTPVIMGLMILKNRKTSNIFTTVWIPVLSVVAIGAYYVVAGKIFGADSRVAGGFGLSVTGVLEGFYQSAYIFVMTHWQYLSGVFAIGLKNTNIFVALLIIIFSVALGVLQLYKKTEENNHTGFVVLMGFAIIIVPLAVHFVAEPVWICLRNVLISVLGVGMVASVLLGKIRINKYVNVALVSVIALVFSISGAGDTYMYKTVYDYDISLITSVSDAVKEYKTNDDMKVYMISDNSFYEQMPAFYNDHVKSVNYTDWSLTGAVRSVHGDLYLKTITPVKVGDEIAQTDNLLFLLEENGNVSPLTIEENTLVSGDGAVLYKIEENILKKSDINS